jgi:histidinol-phosphate aminotransferase
VAEQPDRPIDRLGSIPAYQAGRRAPSGAYKLSSNENPFPPLPGVLAAIADASAEVNRYPDFATSALVDALSQRHGLPAECVSVSTGSVAVLQAICSAFASTGDEVVHAWRSFEAFPIVVTVSGATPVAVPLRPDETHDLAAMRDAITDRTRVVVLCSPNNPTGTVIRHDALASFLADVPPRVVVVLDEAYLEFVRSPHAADGESLLSDHDNLVVLRTFSKAFGLAGLRVGYAIAGAPVATAIRKAQTPFGVTTVAERAALASLAAEPELLERVGVVVAERERVLAHLRRQDWAVTPSQGNFVWLRLGDGSVRFARACEAAGIVVRPFAGEGVRVTIGEPPANDRFLGVAAEWTDG